ncbi:MAG TPA: hypothetical protein VJP02_01780 [Candidatus Sulfotelmatobacter sp.]|nr:hypothetical protein [Candidatus Sulfotelmatobacter sp.]
MFVGGKVFVNSVRDCAGTIGVIATAFIGAGFEAYVHGCKNETPAGVYGAVIAAAVQQFARDRKGMFDIELRSGPRAIDSRLTNPLKFMATTPIVRLFLVELCRPTFLGNGKQDKKPE